MALNTYFLLACADDLNTNAEENETNNCAVATTGAITVTRPDLVEASAAMTPYLARPRGRGPRSR